MASGLTSYQEYIAGTDPCVADTDGDGIPDGFEASQSCLNPSSPTPVVTRTRMAHSLYDTPTV